MLSAQNTDEVNHQVETLSLRISRVYATRTNLRLLTLVVAVEIRVHVGASIA